MPETTDPTSKPEAQPLTVDADGNLQFYDYDAFEAERDRKRPPANVDYKVMWEQVSGENKVLQTSLEALKAGQSMPPVSNSGARPTVTARQLEDRIGVLGINRMSADQCATAVGLPSTPTEKEVLKYLGPKCDTRDSNLLLRTDPLKYRQLREFGALRRII